MLSFCLCCPAFAAETATPLEGYIYVGSFNFAVNDFTVGDNVYRLSGFSASGLMQEDADGCAVSFADQVITLDWYSIAVADGVEMAGIGNLSLYDASFADSGIGFSLVLCKSDKSRNTMICTADFYNQYVSGAENGVFSLALSVPEVTDDPTEPDVPHKGFTKGLFSDVSAVFNSAIGMVGSVANTVSSHPILYLPIIIGLCGIGIAFFRRLKQ